MKLNISVLCVLLVGATLAEEDSTNAVLAATSQSGIVSIGPIVVTNGCSINFAADQSVLKVELTAEINKAKFELAEENRNRMYAIRDEIEKMRKDAVADARSRIKQEFSTLKSDVVKWYDELKDILDVRLNIFTWVIGILVALFGVAAPVVMEVMRGRDYERLKTELREDMKNMQNEFVVEKKVIDGAQEKWQAQMADIAKTEAGFVVLQNKLEQSQKELEQSLHMLEGEMKSRKEDYDVLKKSLEQQQTALNSASDQRKREFEKLQKEMKERTNSAYGVAVAYSALHEWDAYKSGGVLSKAVDSVYGAMVSVNAFVHGHEDGNLLKLCIKHLNATVERLKADGKFETAQKQLQNRKWPVTPEDVKKALASSADDGSGTDYVAMFNEVYGVYGKPK